MPKKMNAKELRQAQQAKKSAAIRAAEEQRREDTARAEAERLAEEQRKAEEAVRKKAEAKKREREQICQQLIDENPELGAKKKSSAKAAGRKATFTLSGNEQVTASFGSGNRALIGKRVAPDDGKTPGERPVFTDPATEQGTGTEGHSLLPTATDGAPGTGNAIDNTAEPKQDLIGCRTQLETKYFGRTFEDNIHIQLIYSILDIDKILAVHVHNAVYVLNNILCEDGEDYADLVARIPADQPFDKFDAPTLDPAQKELQGLLTRMMASPRPAYFGDVFALPARAKKETRVQWALKTKNFRRTGYDTLRCISMMHRSLAGCEENLCGTIFSPLKDRGMKAAVDALYSKRIGALNRDFLNLAGRDIVILFRMFRAEGYEQKRALVRDYYDFIVRKEYKNLDFSIRDLREVIKNRYAPELSEQKYDIVRLKLNRALDFTIHRYYAEHAESRERMAKALHTAGTEAEKRALYIIEAKTVWEAVGPGVRKNLLPLMKGEAIAAIRYADRSVDDAMLQDIKITDDASDFSKLMYLVSNFLDEKEINELFTSLIRTFDNIASFLSVMDELGIDRTFVDAYSLFGQSAAVAEELRVINSFARMRKPVPNAKTGMFCEAAELLGTDLEKTELQLCVRAMLDKKNKPADGKGKRDMGFRNFIARNVIESERFKYLIRYGEPKKLRALARNRKVTGFVLKGIPDAQILQYYNACTGSSERECAPEMRTQLAELLRGVTFMGFENIRQQRNATAEQRADKERKKNLVRLYLTVLYLAVKNLVYVNSRYLLAFHCAKRDALTADPAKYGPLLSEESTREDSAYAVDFVAAHTKNRRMHEYITRSIADSDPWAVRAYRNCVMRIDVVRNADIYARDIASIDSYFALYHYIVQRTLMTRYAAEKDAQAVTLSGKTEKYFALVERYHTYSKDFVKALNVPFAYNLPRYKNLSIAELFDRNRPPEREGAPAIAGGEGVQTTDD